MTGYTASSLYGTTPQGPSYGVAVGSPTAHMGTDDVAAGWRGLLDHHNPLFWVGVVLAVTFGFAGVAGSARVGRARISAQLDKD